MTEAARISRKQFLRGWLRPSAGAKTPSDAADLAMLQSDFPPELLDEEAARLGLDPKTTDRDTVLRAVLTKMQAQRGA